VDHVAEDFCRIGPGEADGRPRKPEPPRVRQRLGQIARVALQEPILRAVRLAMFPTDQVQVDLQNGKSEFMDVYLVEARSIKGLSGSPVFVRESVAVLQIPK
jgi:hypothetical protein